MDIVEALKQEESRLHRQLTALQGAIAVLNDGAKTEVSLGPASSPTGTNARRTMSAAARAKMSRAAKLRWAKIRAEKAKKTK
jgi:DNA-binding IclR family transcriptional regulator